MVSIKETLFPLTKLSVPFNGSLDYSIFASKVLVDFVFEQTGTPAFPYDDFLAAE